MHSSIIKSADQKFCSACGNVLHNSAVQCIKCGAMQNNTALTGILNFNVQKAADQKFCLACGIVIHNTATSCPRCGASQGNKVSNLVGSGSRSRTSAALLALFLGGLGAHKFYLGKTTLGIVYLVFCWTFIPCILAFFEGVIYLTMTDEKFSAKYD
jgi:RNA polymerase subunit RPABC4/transcription elongation factor Spt4